MNPNFPSRQNEERLSLPVNAVAVNAKSMMPGDYYDQGPVVICLNGLTGSNAGLNLIFIG